MSNLFLDTNIKEVKTRKIRDLSYFEFGNNTIAFSCDSSGSVGSRKEDRFRESAYRAGIVLLEVPLKEIISCGMEPIAIYLDFCYQDDEYNREFLRGLTGVIESVGYSKDILFVKYGDYNKEPLCSSYGVTIVSKVQKEKFRLGKSKDGDLIYVIGLPTYKDLFDKHLRVGTLKKILDLSYVHEALPGGSHGLFYESEELAKTVGLEFVEGDNDTINSIRAHSCGAACCCLVSVDPEYKDEFEKLDIPNPINLYGILKGTKNDDNFNFGSATEYALQKDGSIIFSDGYKISSTDSQSFSVGKKENDETFIYGLEEYGVNIISKTLEKLNSNLLIIINNLGFGMKDGANEIILKTREKLKEKYKDINLDAQFTGSTEDNWPSVQTGIAVRIFGFERTEK